MLPLKHFILLLLALCVSAAKLKIELEPALAYHAALPEEENVLFFKVVTPFSSDSKCESVCATDSTQCDEVVCGGSFLADLSFYDSIEVKFEARVGEEIFVRHPIGNPIIRAEFKAATENCTDTETLFVNKKVKISKVDIVGSDTEKLKASFVKKTSFLEMSSCSINARIEFRAPVLDTDISGRISAVSFSMGIPVQKFSHVTSQKFMYDTDGFSWITTPFNGSLVPLDTKTENGTFAPAPLPTEYPTRAPQTFTPIYNSPAWSPITWVSPTSNETTAPTSKVPLSQTTTASPLSTDQPSAMPASQTLTASPTIPVSTSPPTAMPVSQTPTASPVIPVVTLSPIRSTGAPVSKAPTSRAPTSRTPVSASPVTKAPATGMPFKAPSAPVARVSRTSGTSKLLPFAHGSSTCVFWLVVAMFAFAG